MTETKWAYWIDISGASHKVEAVGEMADGRYVVRFPGRSLMIVPSATLTFVEKDYPAGVYQRGELIQEFKEGERSVRIE